MNFECFLVFDFYILQEQRLRNSLSERDIKFHVGCLYDFGNRPNSTIMLYCLFAILWDELGANFLEYLGESLKHSRGNRHANGHRMSAKLLKNTWCFGRNCIQRVLHVE